MVAINLVTTHEPMYVRVETSPPDFVPLAQEPMNVLCSEDVFTSLSQEHDHLKMRLAVAERNSLEQCVASAQADNSYLRAFCQALGVRLAPQVWTNGKDFSRAEEVSKPSGLHSVSTWKSVGLETSSDTSTVDSSPESSDSVTSIGDAISSVDSEEMEANTLIMQNIPNRYTRTMLLALFDKCGYQNSYNLVYLPIDFETSVNSGFAFVHLVSSEVARRFKNTFHGFAEWTCNSSKICAVDFCTEQNGLDSLIKRYQNSPVMHELVPDEFKPALFFNGERTAFPHPTKKLKKPRMKVIRALS